MGYWPLLSKSRWLVADVNSYLRLLFLNRKMTSALFVAVRDRIYSKENMMAHYRLVMKRLKVLSRVDKHMYPHLVSAAYACAAQKRMTVDYRILP